MPKIEIDYSNTIIYKITCKDKSIKDTYVGHTTNFVQRKHAHKQSSKTYKCSGKLYEVIRAYGGWENWQMETVITLNCADQYEARVKEQEFVVKLNANLNSVESMPEPTKPTEKVIKQSLFCNICQLTCSTLSAFDKHNKTVKHQNLYKSQLIQEQEASENNNLAKFVCKTCNYHTSRHSQYTRHLGTIKHIDRTKSTNSHILGAKSSALFQCDNCDKNYKDRTGLWKHKKKCNYTEPCEKDDVVQLLIKENTDFKNIILDLVKNNGDLQKQMLDVCKSTGSGGSNVNNSYNNNNNKTFNIQLFLNEQCKDAMNIMDFVNSMTLELSDLEDVGEMGYVEGISKIIIRKLNELDVCKRPIHCSDFKRAIMYVKDMDIWAKENSTFDKIRKAIKYVTKKNGDLLIPWIQKYPTAMNIQHPHNDIYMRIMNQAMGGRESFIESENKIIKKISKAVQIDKKYNKCQ
jgi:hypothetical protein